MDHRPQAWGRPRDDVYGAYDPSYLQTSAGPTQATQSPIVTGTSVVAMKFKDGIVMAADNLASYGSLARFTDVKRLLPFASTSIVGFGGDISDMQYLTRHLQELETEESYISPSKTRMSAASLHRYLSKLMYARRNKFDPLWNNLLVGGLDEDDKPFLACADLRGTTYSAPCIATGYGSMLATPIMRKTVPDEAAVEKVTLDEAVEVIKECMKVLFYRDARSMDRYSIAVVTKDGVDLKVDEKLEAQSWAFAERIRGYGTQVV